MKPPGTEDGADPAGAPPGEPGRSMRYSCAEGAFMAVAARLTTGPLCTAMALLLGARAMHLGVLAALGALATVGSAVTAVFAHRLKSRRAFILWTAIAGRSLWLIPAALLLSDVPDRPQLAAFLAVAFLAQALAQMAYNGWQSWITDLVPSARRGRFFGARNALGQAAEMAAAYFGGRWYDLGVTAGRPRATMSLIYLAAALAAGAALFLFARQWEAPARRAPDAIPAAGWRRAWGDGAFRRLLGFCIAWAAATGIVGPFWTAHMIRHLDMSQATIAGYALFFGTANILSQPLWGRLSDRIGQRPILVFTMSLIAFLPLIWLPATRTSLHWIWIDAAVSGLIWPGFNLALFNLLLGTAPRSGRSAGFAMHSIGCGLAAFAAGLLGGAVAESLSGWSRTVGGLALVNHHVLFCMTSVARLALIPLAFRLADHRALRTSAILSLATDKLSSGFAAGWRAVTRPRRGARRDRPACGSRR